MQRWREDGRCGPSYPLPDGSRSECDPDGDKPCCNHYLYGKCGNTAEYCTCDNYCTNFTFAREWKKSNEARLWREDGRCGEDYPLPDGSPSQCDPNGDKPCCSHGQWYGECGKTTADCTGLYSIDYRRIHRDWRESNGTQKWRYDSKCGRDYPLPDGTPGQCDPDSKYPCCDKSTSFQECFGDDEGHCGHCGSSRCIDSRIVREVKESGENCTLVNSSGFLKNICYNEVHNQQSFLCTNSNMSYRANYRDVFEVCDNDPHAYQACGLYNTEISNSNVLCGGYFCEQKANTYYSDVHPYIECKEGQCDAHSRDCTRQSGDDNSDIYNNNGYLYGVRCIRNELDYYLPVEFVCDGSWDCESDEQDCTVTDSTIYTCTHYRNKIISWKNETLTVPIHNYTRCSVVDIKIKDRGEPFVVAPYCLDYSDQTNCTDIERVGGYCKVKGYTSTVSKYMVCKERDIRTNDVIKLCDDDFNNLCVSPKEDCNIHKHRMCDGVMDCSDGSDEENDMCEIMSEQFNFTCTRRFQLKRGKASIPVSWVKDNDTDCMNGEDEHEDLWPFCSNQRNDIALPHQKCQNLFKCPGALEEYVPVYQLCDGVDSCDNGSENDVCKIARDFPPNRKYLKELKDSAVRDVCTITGSTTCETKEFKRPWGDVFGEKKMELSVPVAKVNCSRFFGEQHLFLNCMGLCLESYIICPLDATNRKLEYNSCPGQYPNRIYTLANNSFLTFVEKSESGRYHQDFYKCNNSRCIEYNQVCDLVDDCGDMSDELNCGNHMICQDTATQKRHQFISLSQKCDGIYDCFDLSDECNHDCRSRKTILENWFIKVVSWLIGTLAMVFNCFTVARGIISLRSCETENMMFSKTLMSLVACGDFLIGIYMVTLSVYDSIILGKDFCVHQAEWLTETPCLLLGVISTLGSQISLFTMTVLSFTRMYGIIFKALRVPGPVNRKSIVKVVSIATLIITAAFAVAVTPLVPALEDLFVQGIYYDPTYKVFIGFPNKDRHLKVLKEYYKHFPANNVSQFTTDLSWRKIKEFVDGMFTTDHGNLTRKAVHFYGNDGVCLFKYFVRTDDARRSRQTSGDRYVQDDPVVWTMLLVNFLCFIIIALCYIIIAHETRKSSKRSGQQDNPERLRDERAVQRKIFVIIATDFLCWVPFIGISTLHNLQCIDASDWYVTFAMLVLPLNSVINPLVYDTALAELIREKFGELLRVLSRGILSAISRTRLPKLGKRDDSGQEPEIVQMEHIDNAIN